MTFFSAQRHKLAHGKSFVDSVAMPLTYPPNHGNETWNVPNVLQDRLGSDYLKDVIFITRVVIKCVDHPVIACQLASFESALKYWRGGLRVNKCL